MNIFVASSGFEPEFPCGQPGSKCASLLYFSERYFGASANSIRCSAQPQRNHPGTLRCALLLPQAFPFKLQDLEKTSSTVVEEGRFVAAIIPRK